jgi:hypothetical protein
VTAGKNLGKTILLSAPNKGQTIDQKAEIAASGSKVIVVWWTKKICTNNDFRSE